MEQVRVCRICGHVNPAEGRSRCTNCWLRLDTTISVSAPVGHQIARVYHLRFLRSRLVRLAPVLAAAVGFAFWGVVVFFELGPHPDLPSTNISADTGPRAWAQVGRTAQNSGYTPEAALPATSIMWTYETLSPLVAAPAVAGDRVFLTTEVGHVIALETATGRLLWRYTSDLAIGSTPAVAGDLVVVSFRPGYVRGLDRGTGDVRWQTKIPGGAFAPPMVVDGTVYIGGANGSFHAIDVATGEERWSFEVDDSVVAPVAYADNMIVVASQSTVIHILDTVTGRKRFVYDTGFPRNARGGVAVEEDLAYFSSLKGFTWAIDRTQITYPFERAILYWKQNLYVWNVLDDPPIQKGSTWIRFAGGSLVGTPVVDPGAVYVVTDLGLVSSFDRYNGDDRWARDLGTKVAAAPTIAGDTVIVGDEEGTVSGLDSETGEIEWTFRVDGRISASPIAVGGTTYVVTDRGSFYALSDSRP